MMPLHLKLRSAIFGMLALMLIAIPALAQEPVFPRNSRIGIVPPPGFTVSTKFIGFESPQANAALLVTELPSNMFADMERGFTDEVMKQRGMTVATREEITLKDGRGIFIAGPKTAGDQKTYESVLIASVGGITAVLSMQVLEASRATVTDRVVRDAFKTVAVRQIPDAEKLAVLPYKIGSLGGFRILRSAPNGAAILTLGPKDEPSGVEQPYVMIGLGGGEPPKAEERDRFARAVLANTPGIKDIKILRAEPLRIGQAQGYEIVAEARDTATNSDVTTVMWLRFGQAGHLQIFGIARRNAWSDVFPRLRTIRDAIDVSPKS
jgi:hypothetical protein